jgi:hypothetical protein
LLLEVEKINISGQYGNRERFKIISSHEGEQNTKFKTTTRKLGGGGGAINLYRI